MKLYYDPRTVNCRKVVAGFKHMGVEPSSPRNVNYFEQGTEGPRVPRDQSQRSAAGTRRRRPQALGIERDPPVRGRQGRGPSRPIPKDLATRADVNRWLLWEASAWFPTCYVYLVENVVKPILEQEPDRGGPRWRRHRTSTITPRSSMRGSTGRTGSAGRTIRPSPTSRWPPPMHLHSVPEAPPRFASEPSRLDGSGGGSSVRGRAPTWPRCSVSPDRQAGTRARHGYAATETRRDRRHRNGKHERRSLNVRVRRARRRWNGQGRSIRGRNGARGPHGPRDGGFAGHRPGRCASASRRAAPASSGQLHGRIGRAAEETRDRIRAEGGVAEIYLARTWAITRRDGFDVRRH